VTTALRRKQNFETGTIHPDVKIILCHIDPPKSVREYAMTKLGETIYSVPGPRHASIEITFVLQLKDQDKCLLKVCLKA
jgi:hypothetical protein